MNITQEQPSDENKSMKEWLNNFKVKAVLKQMYEDQMIYGVSGCKLDSTQFTILTQEEIAKLKNL